MFLISSIVVVSWCKASTDEEEALKKHWYTKLSNWQLQCSLTSLYTCHSWGLGLGRFCTCWKLRFTVCFRLKCWMKFFKWGLPRANKKTQCLCLSIRLSVCRTAGTDPNNVNKNTRNIICQPYGVYVTRIWCNCVKQFELAEQEISASSLFFKE